MGKRNNPPTKVWLCAVAVQESPPQHLVRLGCVAPGEPLSAAARRVLGEVVVEEAHFRGVTAVRSWSTPEAFNFALTVVLAAAALREADADTQLAGSEEWPAELLGLKEQVPDEASAILAAPCLAPVEDRFVGGGGGVFVDDPRLPLDVVVFLMLFNAQSEVLLVRESKPKCHGKWFPPAGHVEAGETLHEACARELVEETFLRLDHSTVRIVDIVYGAGRRYSPLHFVVVADAIAPGPLKSEADADAESIDAAWRSVPEVLAQLENAATAELYRNPEEVSYVLRTAVERHGRGCCLPLCSLPAATSGDPQALASCS